ncbi:MAG: hypothetical protein HKN09_03565 [Saprospiraceae bacterium]|nr:hypothetical protein [Saprospiraceae bacterium]
MAQYLKNGLAITLCLITLYPCTNYAQLDLLPCTCMTSSLEIAPEFSYEIVIVKEEETEGFSWKYESPEVEIPLQEVVDEEILPQKPVLPAPFYDIMEGRDRYIHDDLESLRNSTYRRVRSKGKIRIRNQKFKKYSGKCPRFN